MGAWGLRFLFFGRYLIGYKEERGSCRIPPLPRANYLTSKTKHKIMDKDQPQSVQGCGFPAGGGSTGENRRRNGR